MSYNDKHNRGRGEGIPGLKYLKEVRNLKELKAEKMLKIAEEIAKELGGKLDTQLRRIFDTFRNLQMEFQREGNFRFDRDKLLLVKPRIIYTVARKKDLAPILEPLMAAIDKVHDETDFERLMAFVESILAYYKGKELLKKRR